jgi:hypothetical protein
MTDDDTKLDLPFETTDDINIIQTVNYYFTKMLNIEWLPCDTFDQYLAKIKRFENKHFDIQNFSEIALNTLITKQIQDLKIKIKEHIMKIDFLFANQWSIRRDLWKMEDIHKNKHLCITNSSMITTNMTDLRLINTLDIWHVFLLTRISS